MSPRPLVGAVAIAMLVLVGGYVEISGATADIPQSTVAPVSSASSAVASVADPSVTRSTQVQVAPTQPPPLEVGLFGYSFAPPELSGCAEMRFYRRQFNLPEHFDVVGFRESSCRNDVTSSTGCCHGWWQIHEIHIGERHLEHCGITAVEDMRGDAPIVKQRQTCAALAVYLAQGSDAWEATW